MFRKLLHPGHSHETTSTQQPAGYAAPTEYAHQAQPLQAEAASKLAQQRDAYLVDRSPGGAEGYTEEVVEVHVPLPKPEVRIIDHREELDAKEGQLHQLTDQLQGEKRYTEGLGAELSATRHALDNTEKQLAGRELQLAGAAARLQEQEQAERQHASQVESELAAAQLQLKETMRLLAAKDAQLNSAARLAEELELERRRAADLESQLPLAQRQLQEAARELSFKNRELNGAGQERALLSGQLHDVANQATVIQSSLESEQARARQLQDQLAIREADLAALMQQLQQRSADQDNKQRLLEAADQEIRRLDLALQQRHQQVRSLRGRAGELEEAVKGTAAQMDAAVLAEHRRMEENQVYLLNQQISTQQVQLDQLEESVAAGQMRMTDLEAMLHAACVSLNQAVDLVQRHKGSLVNQVQQLESSKNQLEVQREQMGYEKFTTTSHQQTQPVAVAVAVETLSAPEYTNVLDPVVEAPFVRNDYSLCQEESDLARDPVVVVTPAASNYGVQQNLIPDITNYRAEQAPIRNEAIQTPDRAMGGGEGLGSLVEGRDEHIDETSGQKKESGVSKLIHKVQKVFKKDGTPEDYDTGYQGASVQEPIIGAQVVHTPILEQGKRL